MVALLEKPCAPSPSAFAASEIVPLPEFTFALIASASRALRVTVPLLLPIAWLTVSVPAPTVRTSSAPPDVVMPLVVLPDPLSEVIEPMVRLLASKYVSGLAPDRLAAIVVISFVVLAREKVPPPRRRRPAALIAPAPNSVTPPPSTAFRGTTPAVVIGAPKPMPEPFRLRSSTLPVVVPLPTTSPLERKIPSALDPVPVTEIFGALPVIFAPAVLTPYPLNPFAVPVRVISAPPTGFCDSIVAPSLRNTPWLSPLGPVALVEDAMPVTWTAPPVAVERTAPSSTQMPWL